MSESDPNTGNPNPDQSKPREPIPAYRDTFVHFLFGTPGNEPILLHFLNAVLESDGQQPARSVEMRNPFNPATFVTDKYTILDVRAKDERGDIFVVEFQTSERATFADRMTYYGSRAFGGQMLKGDPYSSLKAVIAIAITTFEMFRQLKSIHNSFRLTAKANPNVVLTHLLQMHILEATKEKIDRVALLPPALGAWMNFIYYSHLKSEAEMSTLLNGHTMVEQAYGKYQEFNHDERLRALDEAHQRFLHDLATDIEAAHEKGRGEGREEGREKMLETLSRILTRNFGEVPSAVRDKLYTIHNLDLLGQLTDVALDCQSFDQFEQALSK
ncbi:MAG: Rpn family recombination-promoting nuclease/putative transposase [Planctomycetaceae bacterium]|nr:Rpn family recombination-promoting nuclease/putative transposase [Planctomycetaceae bacterium]